MVITRKTNIFPFYIVGMPYFLGCVMRGDLQQCYKMEY